MFEKLDTSSIKDRALKALEENLLSGKYRAGDRLPPEREIAEEMGVSRAVISMCMLELEAKGFVKSVPRQGTFVVDYMKNGTPAILSTLMHYESIEMQHELFDNLMDTRLHLECECAGLAAEHASGEDLENLRRILEAMKASDDGDGFSALDYEFHHLLCAAGGNAVFAMIFKSFEGVVSYFQKLAYASPAARERSVRMHGALLEAVERRDREAAEETMRRIITSGIRTLETVYRKQ